MNSWLTEHLENFVKPYVGSTELESLHYAHYFTTEEMTVIKNQWRSAKSYARAKGKKILLAGRDCWAFEILARRENYNTLFLPECSRLTVSHIKLTNPSDYILLDTGFLGSIGRGLGVDYVMVSSINVAFQTFPKLTRSRSLALKIEYMPKYWRRGYCIDGQVKQELSDKDEFTRAAKMTIEIYKDSSRKFIERSKPMGTGTRLHLPLWDT